MRCLQYPFDLTPFLVWLQVDGPACQLVFDNTRDYHVIMEVTRNKDDGQHFFRFVFKTFISPCSRD